MKAATGIGIGLALLGILGGALIEGTPLGTLMNIPAILIVFVGTAGVTLAAVGMDVFKRFPALVKKAISGEAPDLGARATELVGYAEQARKDGLLSLEGPAKDIADPFSRKAVQLVVDGTEAAALRAVLESEIDAMHARHAQGVGMFEKAGGFAPTIGIIGAVLGLMHALGYLSEPEKLGEAIASAFVATVFGVGVANIFFLPVGNRLEGMSKQEIELREMTMEGALAIQAGENPRIISERLETYIAPSVRPSAGGGEGGAAATGDAQRQAA
ncbi:flagellar motor protein [Patulibacter sp. SYSU D01012]|uniref:flagellar motor protein n=1 Tax=Patulibacter sp. SYSU D01012 TaxID=2817381 RepID=UPI001B316392|nr:flagellar motor protein [Patulibacter sp. SYSU D01012]